MPWAQRDDLTAFQQAKAVEVNLNVVKSVASAQGSTSTFHYFIHPRTSGAREYRVRALCLRFLQKHGGINEHQAISGNPSQNNDYLPGNWRSVPSPQGRIGSSLPACRQHTDCSHAELRPGFLRLRSRHRNRHHCRGSIHRFPAFLCPCRKNAGGHPQQHESGVAWHDPKSLGRAISSWTTFQCW